MIITDKNGGFVYGELLSENESGIMFLYNEIMMFQHLRTKQMSLYTFMSMARK